MSRSASSLKSSFSLLGLLFLAGACVKPVMRTDPQLGTATRKEPLTKAQKRKVKKYKNPDLKKKVWVLPFTKSYAATNQLERYGIPEILQIETFGVISQGDNPFMLPTEDQKVLRDVGIDSSTPVDEIARMARGADIAGFIRGDITKISVEEEEQAEGVLRTRRVDLVMETRYELYDAISGKKIHEGISKGNMGETRSDIFNLANQVRQPRRKLGRVAKSNAMQMIGRMEAYAGKLGWTGKILKVEGNRIYVNSGRKTGIKVGDVLRVLERSREVFDPDHGSLMGYAPGRIKATIKITQYFDMDGAVATLQSGGGVFPGDRIELY